MKIDDIIKVKKESDGYSIYLDGMYLMTTESETTVNAVRYGIESAFKKVQQSIKEETIAEAVYFDRILKACENGICEEHGKRGTDYYIGDYAKDEIKDILREIISLSENAYKDKIKEFQSQQSQVEGVDDAVEELMSCAEIRYVKDGNLSYEYIEFQKVRMSQILNALVASKDAEIQRLQGWVNDLHSGMYINCVYCGHRYGPIEDTPVAMADVLKEHIENCPKHPMSKLKVENQQMIEKIEQMYAEIQRLREALEEVYHWSMKPTTYPQTEVDFPWAEWQVKAEQALESEEFNE